MASYSLFKLKSDSSVVCLVIGQGLIGSAVSEELKHYCDELSGEITGLDVNWETADGLKNVLLEVAKRFSPNRLEVVWCAGKAGFGADDERMQREYDYYSEFLESLKNLESVSKKRFSLISSAGGLYENSGLVTESTRVSPLRPYGKWKLKQERLIEQLGIESRIYRASSVYGLGSRGARRGLIANMFNSALLREPMTIYAKPNTLRDYIYNVDIAKAVVADIINDVSTSLRMMVTGRASSINMLLNMIAKVSGQRVLATFIPDESNDQDIVFSQQFITKGAGLTTLEEGLSLLHRRIKSS